MLLTLNLHDQFRDAKQTDKAVFNLATGFFSPEVQAIVVELLNKANKVVREAHESQRGAKILKGKRHFQWMFSVLKSRMAC